DSWPVKLSESGGASPRHGQKWSSRPPARRNRSLLFAITSIRLKTHAGTPLRGRRHSEWQSELPALRSKNAASCRALDLDERKSLWPVRRYMRNFLNGASFADSAILRWDSGTVCWPRWPPNMTRVPAPENRLSRSDGSPCRRQRAIIEWISSIPCGSATRPSSYLPP